MNYIDHILIGTSTVTGCVSISTFSPLVGIPVGIASSTIGLKTCVITEADLRGSAGGAPLFFAITLKNYRLCYSKLNWSLMMRL